MINNISKSTEVFTHFECTTHSPTKKNWPLTLDLYDSNPKDSDFMKIISVHVMKRSSIFVGCLYILTPSKQQ